MASRIQRSSIAILLGMLAAAPALANAYQRDYLVNSVRLPSTVSEATNYAIDLDGDGHVDNQFGSTIAALSSLGLDFQGSMDTAVAAGQLIHLVRVQSMDDLFANDPAAQADWCMGAPTPAPPLFDGTDTPTCDNRYTPGTFLAALAGGVFTSPSPVTTTNPVEVTLQMAFGPYVYPLTLQSARLSFQLDESGHMLGQLNGSINHADIPTMVDPAFAQWFNWIIQNDPGSSTAMSLKSAFDTGCAGQSEFANDGWIEVCELQENTLLQTLLAPDVQTRDSLGNYVNANSFGVRFTAVVSDRVFANGFESN